VQSQPKQDAYSLGIQGILKVDNGDYKAGIKLLKRARNLEPKEYDYAFEIGKAYFKSGKPRTAEKYFFELQYHSSVQADLYVLLSRCYEELEALKKNPNPENKKAMDVLRYGIQKLPKDGVLYLELAQQNIKKEKFVEALAILESGIRSAPNFTENYYWAAKLLMTSDNYLWAWLYSEICYNQTDDLDLKRSAARIIEESTVLVFSESWQANPEKLDQDIRFIFSKKCKEHSDDVFDQQILIRSCLLENWDFTSSGINTLIDRLKFISAKGWNDAYVWSILQESNKEVFLKWIPENGNLFDAYRNWSYWNPMLLKSSVNRLAN
jgi:hypothetical protein